MNDYRPLLSLDGRNAFQLAVAAGFEGSEAQWLESLRGAPGVADDASVKALIDAPASATRAALSATIDAVAGPAVAAAVAEMQPSTGFVVTSDPDWPFVVVAVPGPAPEPLSAPTLESLTAGKNSAVAVWTAPTPVDELAPITDYRVRYRRTGDTGWTNFEHDPSTALELTITGLANGAANVYEVQVAAVNAAGVGAWSNTLSVTPGAVNGVVFRDPNGRTAAEIVGTAPATGPESWTGTAGQFEAAGGYLAAKSGASGSLLAVGVGAHGLVKWEGVVNIDTLAASAGISTRLYVKLGASTSDVAYLRIDVNAAGSCTFSFVCIAGGTTISNTFGMPAGAIPATTAAADYPVTIEQTSATTYVVTINGTTRTVTLASDPGAALANASRIGLTANSARIKHKITAVSVNGYYN